METQYFERPEGILAYSDYGGNGELVLMLPGMGALRSEYRFLAPKVSEAGYRAVAVDLRGHGESSVPWKAYDVPSTGDDIVALIEHLEAKTARIIEHHSQRAQPCGRLQNVLTASARSYSSAHSCATQR